MLSFARVRAIAVLALLVIGATVTVAMALGRTADNGETAQDCPEGFVPAELALPQERDTRLNVFNGTTRPGLANQIGENFVNREFEVLAREDHDSQIDGIAELHYGPQAVGAAQLVRAYFLNDATMVFHIEREGDVVDVVLGNQFRQLATPTEVHQAIAAAGNPAPPAGTCPARPD
jgi:hypothetical protein